MTRFAYQARDAAGVSASGVLTAEDRNAAGRQLRSEGKFIVKIIEAADDAQTPQIAIGQRYRHVRRDDVIHFMHQMAMMIETGVTLGEALDSICEQCPNEHFRAVLDEVRQFVQGGGAFSEALARHPRVFPSLAVALLRASEASGTMGKMLERITVYLTKDRNTLRSVRGAMLYPAIMTLVALGVTVFLLAFVLPRFSTIYASRGALLPAPTRVLLSISQLVVNYWHVWLTLVAVGVGFVLWAKTQLWGRRIIDWTKLRLPIIGGMMQQLYITRAMRTMGTMINAGVPMLDMVEISRQVIRNIYYERLWEKVDAELRAGSQLSGALHGTELIPSSIVRMVHSGEKSGRLGIVMDRIAEFTEHDFDEAIKRTTQLIEPAMVVLMGTLIGFVAISLLLPIFSISRVMIGGG